MIIVPFASVIRCYSIYLFYCFMLPSGCIVSTPVYLEEGLLGIREAFKKKEVIFIAFEGGSASEFYH